MAKSLLNAVNETLKKVNIINANGLLTSLTHTGKQNYIDLAIQIWNEVIDKLYADIEEPRPSILTEATITLVTSDRDYALASDVVIVHFPLLDETNGQYIHEYPGGYMQLVNDQPFPANHTGLPQLGVIRPTDGQLYLDRIPTANENGRVYKYRYSKDTELSAAADEVPFDNVIFRALVPATVELWQEKKNHKFNPDVYKASIGTAARYIQKIPVRESWLPHRVGKNVTDPYAH